MKLECSKKILGEYVHVLERATGKNPTLPILSGILLEAKNNKLLMRSTNLDIGVEVEIPVTIEEEGVVIVPGVVFSNFLSGTADTGVIFLEEYNGNLKVQIGKNKSHIKCFPKEDFPKLPVVSDGQSFNISTSALVEGIKSVVYSSSISDVKPELSSVYIYPESNNIVFVATDSFRLAEKKIGVKNKEVWDGIIIPFKNALDIVKIFEVRNGEIDVHFSKNQIVFSQDSIYVSSRIIDGNFPDYAQIIPKEFKTNIIVLKQDLINMLKMGNVFSSKFNQAVMKISPSKKEFNIEIKNSDIGETDAFIDASVTGEDIEIGFNYKYMSDCFQSIHSDSISIECNNTNTPIVIKGIGDNSFLYLIMPINR